MGSLSERNDVYTPAMDSLRHELDRRTGRRWLVWRLRFEGEDVVMVSPLLNRTEIRTANAPEHQRWAHAVFGPFDRCAKFPYGEIHRYIERVKKT